MSRIPKFQLKHSHFLSFHSFSPYSTQISHPSFQQHEHIWKLNSIVKDYTEKPVQPVTLPYLIAIGEQRNLIQSAEFVRRELPKRLARRLTAIQKLPFIVGTNPHIRSIYQLYLDSFNQLRQSPFIQTSQDQIDFDQMLRDLVESHQDVIPTLAKGFSECGQYMSQETKTAFLDRMIKARIGIRVLAEHHLALSDPSEDWIGIIHKTFQPFTLIESVAKYCALLCQMNYGSCPEVHIDGHTSTTIPFIPVHFEYMMMELMKNAMRATVERSGTSNRKEHPCVQITIAKGTQDVTIRLRDEGGGIPPDLMDRVFDYSFTTVPKYEESDHLFSTQTRMDLQHGIGGPMAGLGFGLPMSRVYGKLVYVK